MGGGVNNDTLKYKGLNILHSIVAFDDSTIHDLVTNSEINMTLYNSGNHTPTISNANVIHKIKKLKGITFDTAGTYIYLPLSLANGDANTFRFFLNNDNNTNHSNMITLTSNGFEGDGISISLNSYSNSEMRLYYYTSDHYHVMRFDTTITGSTVPKNNFYLIELNILSSRKVQVYINGKFCLEDYYENNSSITDCIIGNWSYIPNIYVNQCYGTFFDISVLEGNLHTNKLDYTPDDISICDRYFTYNIFENNNKIYSL